MCIHVLLVSALFIAERGYGPSETGNILLETETEAPDSGYESQDSQDSGYDSQDSVYYLAGQHSEYCKGLSNL